MVYHGRVECLFVAVDRQQWGDYESGGQPSSSTRNPSPAASISWDLAATQTLLHGGAVFAVDPAEVPEAALLAAILDALKAKSGWPKMDGCRTARPGGPYQGYYDCRPLIRS